MYRILVKKNLDVEHSTNTEIGGRIHGINTRGKVGERLLIQEFDVLNK